MAGTEGVEQLQDQRDAGTLQVVSVAESDLFTEFRRELDTGESAALAYAVREDASLVLIDEREGRQAARRHGLRVTGVVGILMRAANGSDLGIESELDALRDTGFWISEELYRTAIERVQSDSGSR
jgi:predicted nucleic acid-binding protein